MEQRRKFRRPVTATICQSSVCFCIALLLLFFMMRAPLAEAQVQDWPGLSGAFGSAGDGGAIEIQAGVSVPFSHSQNALSINKQNITLRGGAESNFYDSVGELAADEILNEKDDISLTTIGNRVQTWRDALTSYSTLSGIRGDGTARNLTSSNDNNKWLSTPQTTAQSAYNGLSLENLRLGDVDVAYSGDKFVNGLIGNNHLAGETTRMGHITGNLFEGISVTLRSGDDTDYLAGGGVVGVRSTGSVAGALAEIDAVSGNIFENIDILTTNDAGAPATVNFTDVIHSAYLEGGGLVGVNGVSSPGPNAGHAVLNQLTNNFFTDIHIGSNDILLGGGLVGVNNNSKNTDEAQTYARLGDVSGNVFGSGADGDITVTLENSLRGGGVIGVNGLSSAEAQLGYLQNNAFAGISVKNGSYIKGGGIVGLQTNDQTAIKPDYGSDGPANATLTEASGNLFLDQEVSAGSYIEGGGVIGLRSGLGVAALGTLTGNVFRGIAVNSGEAAPISGGGVVGLSAATEALMGHDGGIRDNIFDDIHVTTGIVEAGDLIGNDLNGGGIIGIHARDASKTVYNWATMEEIENNRFTRSEVLATSINGGGIIGVNAGGAPDEQDFTGGVAAFGTITGNTFEDLQITTFDVGDGTGHLEGGGVVGLWNKDNEDGNTYGASAIDEVDNNTFTDITVTAGTYLQGGGIIGMRGSALEQMGTLTRNTFTDNTITAADYIDGGGVIGVTSRDGTSPFAGIKLIGDSRFEGNQVSASGDVFGGIVYSYGLTNTDPGGAGMTIRNSRFIGNTLSSEQGIVYGAVTVDTGAAPMAQNTNTLTLTADSGERTEFRDNTIADNVEDVFADNQWASPRLPSERTNSLYFGTIYEPGGNPDPAEWSPELIVEPQAGGVVALYDPIWVNQADPDPDDDNYVDEKDPADLTDDVSDDKDYTFTMNVRGGGDFIWGGNNVFTLDTATAPGGSIPGDNGTSGTVTLERGSSTTLLDGSSTTTVVNGDPISGDYVKTMTLDAPNFKFTLENGATLNVEGHNRFDLSGDAFTSDVSLAGEGDGRGATVADLNGNLHFNLHNTSVYSRGQLPADYAGNPAYQPLLTIKVPGDGQGKVSVAGSTVSLSAIAEAGPKLKGGDRFYLIELDNGITNDPGNKVFTSGNPVNGTAYVRQGMLTRYTLVVDKNMDNLGKEEDTRFLVARLPDGWEPEVVGPGPDPGPDPDPGPGTDPGPSPDPYPAPEFDSPNTGRIAGVTVLQRVSDRLLELEFFGPDFLTAEPYILRDPCETCIAGNPREARRDPSGWRWTGFADVKGSWYRADTSRAGDADIKAAYTLGGIAGGRRLDDGHIQAGLLADASQADYDTVNHVLLPEGMTTIHGQGEIDTVGGGAFLRRNWNNGFGVDVMVRGGTLENEYFSGDIVTNDIAARYKLNTTYLGAGVKLNYERQYGKNTFDVYGRYSWHRENGGSVTLSTQEIVDFETLDSHRLTGGARLTRQTGANLAWYIDGAYEHELDGSSRAEEISNGGAMSFDGVSLRGGTGVGQIGLILNPRDNVSVTLGLEGYIGQREGGSASASIAYRF